LAPQPWPLLIELQLLSSLLLLLSLLWQQLRRLPSSRWPAFPLPASWLRLALLQVMPFPALLSSFELRLPLISF